MKNKTKKFFCLLILASIMIPTLALAAGWNIDDIEDIADTAGLTVDKSFTEIIGFAIGWIMTLLAITAVLMFVVAGAMYVTAQGDEEVVKKAKKIMTYAITGLVISLCGFLIVEVIKFIAGD